MAVLAKELAMFIAGNVDLTALKLLCSPTLDVSIAWVYKGSQAQMSVLQGNTNVHKRGKSRYDEAETFMFLDKYCFGNTEVQAQMSVVL